MSTMSLPSILASLTLLVPLAALQNLQMPRLLRQQLLRLCHQATRTLVLDLVLRDERCFLGLDDAGAGSGTSF